jgi:hypothetical protein
VYRPYVTDIPARKDLDFRTNSDQTIGVVWLGSDGETPVPVDTAVLTLEFDVTPPPVTDPPTPPDPPVVETFDPDPAGLPNGQILFTVPAGLWATVTGRSGNLDVVATSTAGTTRALLRGIFIVEEGVG